MNDSHYVSPKNNLTDMFDAFKNGRFEENATRGHAFEKWYYLNFFNFNI